FLHANDLRVVSPCPLREFDLHIRRAKFFPRQEILRTRIERASRHRPGESFNIVSELPGLFFLESAVEAHHRRAVEASKNRSDDFLRRIAALERGRTAEIPRFD